MKHQKPMRSLEDQLLFNSFPYPRYYDGQTFNTIENSKRKSLPKYLREGLPTSKYNRIRAKFRQMEKFAPPQIKYFERYIKNSDSSRKKLKFSRQKSSQKHLKDDLGHITEEMQYALVMADRQSNFLVNLLEKANKIDEDLKSTHKQHRQIPFGKKLVKSNRERGSKLGNQTQKYFGNTIDIVFGLKKKQCVERIKAKSLGSIVDQSFEEKLDQIRLSSFSSRKKKI